MGYCMKLCLSLLSLFVLISMPCFAGGARVERNSLHDLHSQDIAKIREYRFTSHISFHFSDGDIRTIDPIGSVIEKEIIEIQKGLFITNKTFQGSNNTRNIISYNLLHNNTYNISDIRLLEILHISEYEIFFSESRIEILSTRDVPMLNERGQKIWRTQEIKLIFKFDSMNRINNFIIINQGNNMIEEEYLFCFYDYWRLSTIYAVYDWGNVVNKAFFWDGQLRKIERPFFNDLQNINIREIIVFENNKLRYHAKRFFWIPNRGHLPRFQDGFLINDDYHVSYLVKFDEMGHIIKKIIFYASGDRDLITFDRNERNLKFDERGNWIYMTTNWHNYRREIIYR